MKFSRFTKTIIVLFVLFVVSLFAWVPISRLFAARKVRSDLEAWAAKISRRDNHFDFFLLRGVELGDPDNPLASKVTFYVETVEPNPGGARTEDPSRFYVTPPGEWVDDIDAVILTWDEQYRLHVDKGFVPTR